VSGSREVLLPLFHTFENHPLLIQALAGVVANDRRTPDDFDGWHRNHPGFNPFQLPLVQARSHVLATALGGLDETAQKVLFTIAAFHMPTSYDTLVALFVGKGKRFAHEDGLVSVLTNLEDRGLLGWDRRANRYDLHPIVRGVTWSGLGRETKQSIYETLHSHFVSLPSVDQDDVKSLDDLTGTIELYNSFIGLERFDDAIKLFEDRLANAIVENLGVVFQAREMLEALFPGGLDQLSSLTDPENQTIALVLLALCVVDQPKLAADLYHRSIEIAERTFYEGNLSLLWALLAEQLCFSGSLYEAEVDARHALIIAREKKDKENESYALSFLGLAFAARGSYIEGEKALKHALEFDDIHNPPFAGECYALLSLWLEQYAHAYTLAQTARDLYLENPLMGRIIRTMWLQGLAALGLGDLQDAEEHLHKALVHARAQSQVVEELCARIGLAELRRQQGDLKAAYDVLDDVWEPAARGPFRLFHADACNVLARIERDAGHREAAIKAATEAYCFAWCDGPPFAYYWGLQKAKSHLSELGAPEPNLPPFESSKHEPMPEVEIGLVENNPS
jgi:tetratricopeptide (TPR) repeat protein